MAPRNCVKTVGGRGSCVKGPPSYATTAVWLWHDDVHRPPSDQWEWARTNDEAKAWLETGRVEIASLDHDMGLHDHDPDDPNSIYLKGSGEDNGTKLVRWMLEEPMIRIPRKVVIHSMNPYPAKCMAQDLADWTVVSIQPYRPSEAIDL